MDTSETEKNKLSKRANSSRMFTLDEFLDVESGDLLSKDSLSFSSDLHLELEERKLYSFEEKAKKKLYKETELDSKEALHIDAWTQKKKKRVSPIFWGCPVGEKDSEYPRDVQAYIHAPVENKTQKLCLGVIKKFAITQEKNTMNSILPLYLNATTNFEGSTQKAEFLKISHNFVEKVDGIDYEALTVQQLKSIMKEFGLNYTGKKQELIARIHQTYQKILQKHEKEPLCNKSPDLQNYEEKTEESATEDPHRFMFF
ncbi:hypothetical protein NECID01_1254 [Nematocida sp. AWRm77]|nr:hypothetical protein NECID01_1254 [Nematocida sp. AWRm77]